MKAVASSPKQDAAPSFDAVVFRAADPHRVIKIGNQTAVVPAVWKPCEYLPARVNCRLPLWAFLREAFNLQDFELTAPDWTKDDIFDLTATMPPGTSRETARLMLQTALREQFEVQYHIAQHVVPVYALIPAPGGTKLQEMDSAHPQVVAYDTPAGTMKTGQLIKAGRYFSAGTSLDIFALNLHSVADLDRPVINETGLAGRYFIDMKWKSGADPDMVLHVIDKGILKATEEQLGLVLVKKDEERNFLSVDHIDRNPKGNS